MAYKIVKQPRAWWPVTFAGVTEEGEIITNSFKMRFRILDEDEQAELMKDETPIEGLPSEQAAAAVLKIAEDWQGVTEDDGSEAGRSLPFTPENLAMLLKVPNVAIGIAAAYRDCRAGIRKGN